MDECCHSSFRVYLKIKIYSRAQQLDTGDHLIEFYIALHYAYNRQLVEAIHHVKLALHLRAEHPPSILLLILLLSAQKEYEEALQVMFYFICFFVVDRMSYRF